MKTTGVVGFPLRVLGAVLALSSLAAGVAMAQTCPAGSTIPNFRFVSSTQTAPRQVTYAWDAPAGAPAGTTYQVLRALSPDYCTGFPALAILAETTGTSQTVTLDTPDRVYEVWVRVKGCDTAATGMWIDDSFTTRPAPPVLSASSTVPGQATLTVIQNDARTAALVIERAGANGVFGQIDTLFFHDLCPSGSAHDVVDSGLSPGTYSYRAWSFNQGTSQPVTSNLVTVVVGGSGQAAPVITFYSATPASVSAGQASTLSWSTTGATSAAIDAGVGSVATSGSVVVHPTSTTTYTLTVTGLGGTSTSRVLVTVAPDSLPGAAAATIVTVVSAPGQHGAYYRTSVQLSNLSVNLSFGRLVFHPKERSGSDGDPFVRYTLQPLQTLELGDVLALIGASGNGSLDIVPEGGRVPLARARIYDDAGVLGTTGVTEEALAPGDALTPGDMGVLLAPSNFQKYRFSIGLRTLASGATLTFTLRGADGNVIRRLTQNYPGTFYLQNSAPEFFEGATFVGNESVTVEVSAGAAFVYATVADNITNDPAMQMARRLP